MAEKKADDLALLAYLYTSGEMNEPEQNVFEERLASEQPVREALAESVRMSATLAEAEPRPDPAYRQHVLRRLRPAWWKTVLGRRTYRGHPLLWLMAGAAAAILLTLTLLRPEPEVREVERTVIVEKPVPVPEAELVEDTEVLQDMAQTWAELHTPEHAVNAVAEEAHRKTRVEDRRVARKNRQMGNTTD